MCGIAGVVDFRSALGISRESHLREATRSLSKRGPDDEGIWIEAKAGFGHRRLAVLDTSAKGHQPMISRDGRFVIVYNGEIYNFRKLREQVDSAAWQSDSDTEVILAAYAKWGVNCLDHLEGMFAFAIWDRTKKTLFLARDRIGIKPLYYVYSQGRILFASRPHALFFLEPDLSEEINEQALRYYLEIGFIPAPHSIYRDVKKIRPAHYLLFSENQLLEKRYWDFSSLSPQPSALARPEEDLLDELDELLNQSVQRHMISDVPLGAFLSGGIDSSLITAIMAKHSSKPIKTFTIGFQEKQYDESSYASQVAAHLKTEHTLEFMHVNDLIGLMDTFLEAYDEPFFDHSAFPTLAVSALTRKEVTVALSGDGGDELFGGYHYYQLVNQFELFFKWPSFVRQGMGAACGLIPRHQFKLLAGAFRQKDTRSLFGYARSIAKDFKHVLDPEILSRTQSIRDLFSACHVAEKDIPAAEQAMRLDLGLTLPDDYLQKVDVASMQSSLEVRVPFLDRSIVEWAMRLPLQWKLRGNTTKYLLRKLAYRYVPREALDRPKRGFGVPIDEWLRGPLRAWAEERFRDESSFKRLPLDQKSVLNLFKLHTEGTRNVHSLLWAILVLLSFRRPKTLAEIPG